MERLVSHTARHPHDYALPKYQAAAAVGVYSLADIEQYKDAWLPGGCSPAAAQAVASHQLLAAPLMGVALRDHASIELVQDSARQKLGQLAAAAISIGFIVVLGCIGLHCTVLQWYLHFTFYCSGVILYCVVSCVCCIVLHRIV